MTVDFPVAIHRVHTLIDGMRQGLRDWLVGVDGLDLVTGTATLVGDPEGRAHQVTVAGETHHAGKVYLDVGGRAALPTIEGLDTVEHLTEVELLQLTELPATWSWSAAATSGWSSARCSAGSAPKSPSWPAAASPPARTPTWSRR